MSKPTFWENKKKIYILSLSKVNAYGKKMDNMTYVDSKGPFAHSDQDVLCSSIYSAVFDCNVHILTQESLRLVEENLI